MKPEPNADLQTQSIKIPSAAALGSGKEAWRPLALRAVDINADLSATIKRQAQTLCDARAELELLRR
ncbi:hypothetical protein [Methylobacterium radiotolerans]|uniref:Uncharacterized protein n=1 Tax=Methylobacterium radiotolerans (strain ATCC 27329 / DSM 1819 / JCM 2831 / NBRC 15690 / NCIMB 10815 / 0-1) TaxID=426355 RepID=B1MAD0_METRJ|nr:hypothetical protein [Methylobacterium radiotolerans]ACB28455.1 hypothetical protein Mrad2831_6543 [Methylobacterium radiotolerans JCM 2831]GEN01712.1 hypothetical protein MRA01_62510 [Methylobacterium radiotolerans]